MPAVPLSTLIGPVTLRLTQVTDSHPWYDQQWLVPVGVIIAGVIAAFFSWWTTRRTLRHDRRMRDRAAARKALDRVVDEIDNASDALNKAMSASVQLELALPDHPRHFPRGFRARLRPCVGDLRAAHQRLLGAAFRLHIWFPDEHPMIPTFAHWREGISQLADEYQALVEAHANQIWNRLAAAHATHHQLGHQLHDFLEAAREWNWLGNPPEAPE
jgi:hypothetical protein